MQDLEEFRRQFCFNPAYRGYIGIEREMFLVDVHGKPVPKSPQFLEAVSDRGAWTYELSACQVEHRTPRLPFDIRPLRFALYHGESVGREAAAKADCRLVCLEVAPADMCLDVYPHDKRYARIIESLSREKLAAACRVAGTHLHFGMGSLEEALAAYNRLVPMVDHLLELGNHSQGRRLELYRLVAGHSRPPIYRSVEHFHEQAVARGFDRNPRDCWDLIRISHHGTVEVRCFGVTVDCDEIISWITACRAQILS